MSNIVKVKSYEELEAILKQYDNKGKYIFRGCTDEKYILSPGVYRDIAIKEKKGVLDTEAEQIEAQEEHDELKRRIRRYVKKNYYFEYYYIRQHYGMKTKLLDFSFDFRVSMIFACEGWHYSQENKDKDGAIYIVKIDKFSDIKSMHYKALGELIVECDEDAEGLIGDEKYDVAYQKEIQLIEPKGCKDIRLSRQKGCFLFFPNFANMKFYIDNKECEKIIIIPKELKQEILHRLKEEYDMDMDFLKGNK